MSEQTERFSGVDFMVLAESYVWNRIQADRTDLTADARRNHIDSAAHRKKSMREITDRF